MKVKILSVIAILSLFVFAVSTMAKDNSEGLDNNNSASESSNRLKTAEAEPSDSPHPEASESPEPKESESPKSKENEREHEFEVKSCEARSTSIGERTTQLMDFVANMEGKFDAIATRVQEFYVAKVVPTGHVVSNYDSLIADIAVKKEAVSAALAVAQADLNNFSCTSKDSPRALFNKFRLDMQAVKKALQNYRTSIKNLIVAVHTAIGNNENESPEPSSSPSASVTPVPTITPVATATP